MKNDTWFAFSIFFLITLASILAFSMGYDLGELESKIIKIDVPAEVEANCPVPSVQLVNDTRYIIKEVPTPVVIRTSFEVYNKIIENYEYYNSDSQKEYLYLENDRDIESKAKELKSDSVEETIDNTMEFLSKIEYKYNFYPNPIYETIATMEGDCTDIANLGVELLRENGIYSRTAHGWFINEEGEYIQHDWIEVLYPIQSSAGWIARDDYFNNPKIEKKGEGVW